MLRRLNSKAVATMTPDVWSVALSIVIAPTVVVGLGYLVLVLYERGSR